MRRLPPSPVRRQKQRGCTVRSWLDYLAAHGQLATLLATSAEDDDDAESQCVERLDAIAAWEDGREDEPLVQLSRDAPPLDLAMLHVLIKDRLTCDDDVVGYPAHGLVRQAVALGPDSDELSYVACGIARLLDGEGPLVAGGFVEIDGQGRAVDRRVTASDSVLRLTLGEQFADDPVELLAGEPHCRCTARVGAGRTPVSGVLVPPW